MCITCTGLRLRHKGRFVLDLHGYVSINKAPPPHNAINDTVVVMVTVVMMIVIVIVTVIVASGPAVDSLRGSSVKVIGTMQRRLAWPLRKDDQYTRSPLEDSRLFGPSPWKILAATYEKNTSEQPSPWRKSSKRESCYGDRV